MVAENDVGFSKWKLVCVGLSFPYPVLSKHVIFLISMTLFQKSMKNIFSSQQMFIEMARRILNYCSYFKP